MEVQYGILILLFIGSLNCFTLVDIIPPQPDQVALMARYIIHNSDWVSIATVSTQSSIVSYPFVNLKSMSDGPVSNGTGVPYLYMTPMDLSGQDVEKDNRCTILASLAESDYCKSQNFDPQDPRCARVILTGHLVKVNNATKEYEFAKNALYTRHPAMKNWPTDHDFYIAKVEIQQVIVLDYFGGAKYVSIQDYFNANAIQSISDDLLFDTVAIVDVEV